MDVNLSLTERNLILVALWQMKLANGKIRASSDEAGVNDLEMGLKIAQGIDQVAFKLGGTDGLIYGLGDPTTG
jgi:hypothetical protein